MRAAAHIAADETMTQAFERGEDLHALTARTMLGLDAAGWLALPEETRKQHRKHAKPVNFGRLYGQGARGLVASAREQYGLVLDLATAKEWIRAFQETYPDYTRWCRDFARLRAQWPHPDRPRGRARARDSLESGSAVPLHPVPQSTDPRRCADAFMLALAMIDAALFEAGIEGGPVAAPHDEIVLEVPEADAARAAHS